MRLLATYGQLWNTKIQSGEAGSVRRELSRLLEERQRSRTSYEFTPEERSFLAPFLRRTGLFREAVLVLHPIVQPKEREKGRLASAFDQIEYAASMNEIGLSREAYGILAKLDPERYPRTLLFQALCLFSERDYDRATPLLERYIQHPSPTHYERLIGKVNLFSCMVRGFNFQGTDEIFKNAIQDAKDQNAKLLTLNLQEIQGLSLAHQGRFLESRECIRNVHVDEFSLGGFDDLYLKFTEALLDWKESKSEDALRVLVGLKTEARLRGNNDLERDIDLQIGLDPRYRDHFLHTYYGTPYKSHKIRALKLAVLENVGEFVRVAEGDPSGSTRRFELRSILEDDSPLTQKSLKRTLSLLLSDFYRGYHLNELHNWIFEDSQFNPESSPIRVRQTLFRLREQLEMHRVPIKLHYTKARGYEMYADKKCALVYDDRKKTDLILEKLFAQKEVASVHDFRSQLSCSTRHAQRWIRKKISTGSLQSEGNARNRRYRIK